MEDLNRFLEKLPHHADKTLLVVAGIIWGVAGALGLFTAVKIQDLSVLSSELAEAEALLPKVPTIQNKPVSAKEVAGFVEDMSTIYTGLDVKGNAANIVITAKSTGQFGEFREAVGHVQNGGAGWRVSLDRFCIGTECQQYPLAAAMKINRVSVDNN